MFREMYMAPRPVRTIAMRLSICAEFPDVSKWLGGPAELCHVAISLDARYKYIPGVCANGSIGPESSSICSTLHIASARSKTRDGAAPDSVGMRVFATFFRSLSFRPNVRNGRSRKEYPPVGFRSYAIPAFALHCLTSSSMWGRDVRFPSALRAL